MGNCLVTLAYRGHINYHTRTSESLENEFEATRVAHSELMIHHSLVLLHLRGQKVTAGLSSMGSSFYT